ncbi:MFS transporter [Aneurinibacillus sp. Ricciae_BoGa-3]|uniref:MFS transporter n=1 Tax=Aneurinibacillus sp. Ricciae_BoGa-3 TaxID=3022697 RepID=UPI00233FD20A|nr:MFS transporter [Aneurinibacillus sp. Ricciae_BoGa-3]WCK56116.1 MFS transporter [Aneurinibacillus sp. Ricciae_BoGa-3]
MEEKKTWDLISAASIPLVMTLGNSMLIPVLPIMEKKLSISPLQASMVITLYSLVAIILIPFAGLLSDRLGRKAIIIPSLIVAGVGGLLSSWAAFNVGHPYVLILIGRLLQGAGAAGAFPIVIPLVGDMFKRKSDVSSGLGIIETSNTLGKVLSPILGAFLASFLWYLPFASIPIFCLISVLLVVFFVKTPKKKEQPKEFSAYRKSIVRIFKKQGRWLYAIFLIGCIAMLVLFGVLFYLSSILEDRYAIDGIMKGMILAIPLAALCLTSYLSGKIIGENKKLMKWLAFSALLLLSVSIFWISFTRNFYFLIFLVCLSGIGIGASLPSLDSLITQEFDKEERGTITSIYSSARFVGVAAGPPIFALLIKFSQQTLFFTITGVCLVAVIVCLFAIRPADKSYGGKTRGLPSLFKKKEPAK